MIHRLAQLPASVVTNSSTLGGREVLRLFCECKRAKNFKYLLQGHQALAYDLSWLRLLRKFPNRWGRSKLIFVLWSEKTPAPLVVVANGIAMVLDEH